jgi:hypothetical protein
MPELGIRMPKRHAGLHGSAVPGPQKNYAAVLLLLRQLTGEQERLPLMHRYAQQQQRPIFVDVEGMRFFMEGVFLRTVSVYVNGNVQCPPGASSPVGYFRCARFCRGVTGFLAGTKRLRVFQCFKNSAHSSLAARLVPSVPDQNTLNAVHKGEAIHLLGRMGNP